MKVILNEDQEIRGKDCEAGCEVLVNKELGERLIDEGLANRLIPEDDRIVNRVIQPKCGRKLFTDHTVFGR